MNLPGKMEDGEEGDWVWVPLGTFTFESGKNKVTLKWDTIVEGRVLPAHALLLRQVEAEDK